VLDIDTDTTGEVSTRFVDYTQAANRDLLTRSMADMTSELPPGLLDMLASYPDSLHCSTAAGGPQDDGSRSSTGCSCSVAAGDRSRLGHWGFFIFLGWAVRRLRRNASPQ